MQRKDLSLGAKTGILILLLAFVSFPVSPSLSWAADASPTATGDQEETIVAATDTESEGDETADGDAGDGGTGGLSPIAIGGIAVGVIAIVAIAAAATGGGGGGGGGTTPPAHHGSQ